jgi:hypothetical protein
LLTRTYSCEIRGRKFSEISRETSEAGISSDLEILQLEILPPYAQLLAVQIETPNFAAKSLTGKSSGCTSLFTLFTIVGISKSPCPIVGLIALKSERFGLSIVFWCIFGFHSYNVNLHEKRGSKRICRVSF